MEDPTGWLRSEQVYAEFPEEKPRIVLAHGSTRAFGSIWHEEDGSSSGSGVIDLDRLLSAEIDYVALGDWHGTKEVGPNAWYAGTPELDRFPKGEDYDPGNVLVVDVQRGQSPTVTKVTTGRIGWHNMQVDLADDSCVEDLERDVTGLVGQRVGEDLLALTLSGGIGMQALDRLERVAESLGARLLQLQLVDETILAPSDEEMAELTESVSDPLIARVASRLVESVEAGGEEAVTARVALRELYLATRQGAGS